MLMKIDKIAVRDGFNPRAAIDQDQLDALTTSIQSVGVLVPITVNQDGEVIDGHRRLAAALQAGLEEIPVFVHGNGDTPATAERIAAVAANIQRVDLAAIDEARAYRQLLDAGQDVAGIAAALGRSQSHVISRVAILELPDYLAPRLGDDIPLGCLPNILRLKTALNPYAFRQLTLHADYTDAEQRPGEGWITLRDFPAEAAGWISDRGWQHELHPGEDDDLLQDEPLIYPLANMRPPIFDPTDDVSIEFEARWEKHIKQLNAHDWDGRYLPSQEFADAARAYGCLLEFDATESTHRWGRGTAYITDREFLLDQAMQWLERQEKKRKASRQPAAAAGADGDDEAAAKEARRAEREAAQEAAVAARSFNLAAGRALAEKLEEPKMTKDLAKLIAALAIESEGSSLTAAWPLIREEFQHAVVNKKGETTRIDYGVMAPKRDPRTGKLTGEAVQTGPVFDEARAWVLRGRNAETILGRLAQLIIAARIANTAAITAASKRPYPTLPGRYNTTAEGAISVWDLAWKLAKKYTTKPVQDQLLAVEAEEAERDADDLDDDLDLED